MKALIIIIIILAVIAVIFCAASAVCAYIMTHGDRQTLDFSWNWEQEHVPLSRELTRDMFKEYIVKSEKGEDIHTCLLPAPEGGKKYVILAHGYTDNRYGMIKYAVHYRRLGFNCVMFDERGHGLNKKEPCSYSVREVDFLIAVLKDTFERYGEDITVGLQGESLGSATVLTALGYDIVKEKVAFAVDDCGFAEIRTVIMRYMKVLHVPPFMFYPANIAARLMYGIDFLKAVPLRAVSGNKIPLLCVHGANDDFILPEHCRQIYGASAGPKEIRLVEGAGHAASAVVDPDGYYEMLKAFIGKVL